MTSSAGPIALVGSGEFLPQANPIDRHLIEGRPQRAVIIPTASGQEGDASIDRWINLGVDHYRSLDIEPVPVRAVDAASANDPELASLVEGAGLIYFSGGDPSYVTATMRGSLVWDAVRAAWRGGAALAGCSAGAMMMGSVTASPRRSDLLDGLGVFEGLCVLPHFDRFDQARGAMASTVAEQIPSGTALIGVDEDTALIVEPGSDETLVLGRQSVWHLNPGEQAVDRDARPGWADGQSTDLALTLSA